MLRCASTVHAVRIFSFARTGRAAAGKDGRIGQPPCPHPRSAHCFGIAPPRDFAVPPENLVTQGYGAQNLRVQTGEAERRNRRVVVRRITQLLNGQNGR